MVVVGRQPRAKRQQLLRAATASLVLLACVAALLGSRAHGYLPAIANCALSLRESHGFFCEPDAAWRLRREVADWQHGRQVVTEYDDTFATYMGRWWQANYEPNFSCAFERRLGRSGDGGKWVCDPHRVEELSRSTRCVVYSVGSNNDFTFEASILEALPRCEVHTFDHTIVPSNVPRGVKYHAWGLAAKDDGGKMKTLSTIQKELGHDQPGYVLEILKVDVEGSEWTVFNPLLEMRDFPFARQLLIELHPTDLNATRRYFELMHEIGYRIAHKEPNTEQGGILQEYNFFKLNFPNTR